MATGNGPWNGSTDWGDSTLVLSPDAARLLRHWTPTNQKDLEASDGDLGSTSPGLLAGGLAVQGGKDGKVRLLQLHRLPGVNARLGGELQTIPTPGGGLFSVPAIWKGKWVFLSTDGGTAAWLLRGGRLHSVWSNGNGGTSPVLAGNLLYVAGNGSVHVYVPTSGKQVATLPSGAVHWQSPIVVDGHVAMPEGNANDHATTGVLDIYKLSAAEPVSPGGGGAFRGLRRRTWCRARLDNRLQRLVQAGLVGAHPPPPPAPLPGVFRGPPPTPPGGPPSAA